MFLTRISTRALRTNLRPCVARAQFHASSLNAVKLDGGKDMDDAGGPFGQSPIPEKPAGPEAAKRNWLPITAGVLTLTAGIWYLTSSSDPKKEKLVTQAKQLEQQGLNKANHGLGKAEEMKNQGLSKAEELKNRGLNKAEELKNQGLEKAGDLKNQGAAKAQQWENRAKTLAEGDSKGLREMSGREKGATPFRSE